MLFEALRDSVRYPAIWLAAAGYAAFDAVQLVLSLQGETFFSVRLLVLEYLLLPFLLAGAYGVLREQQSSARLLVTEGVRNYFRVLLPGLVVGFGAALVLFLVLTPLPLLGLEVTTDLAAGAALAVLIPVLFFSSLYDTAACYEGLGVFASLRRSFALVLAHIWEVLVFALTTFAVLLGLAFVLLLAWTTVLYDRLAPLASLPASELASFGSGQLAAMVGTSGLILAAVLYAVFILLAFVLVATYKARLFQSIADATPPGPQGVYDEKGRYYRY